MAVLIDTSVLINLERGSPQTWLEEQVGDEPRAISVITVSELLHGVHRAGADQRARRRAYVEHVLAGFSPLEITEPIARIHGELGGQLADAGTPMATHDLWIAATALVHGMAVATANAREFGRIAGLRVIASP